MALIPCPECNNSVSEKAASCPKCGSPIHETRRLEIRGSWSADEYSSGSMDEYERLREQGWKEVHRFRLDIDGDSWTRCYSILFIDLQRLLK